MLPPPALRFVDFGRGQARSPARVGLGSRSPLHGDDLVPHVLSIHLATTHLVRRLAKEGKTKMNEPDLQTRSKTWMVVLSLFLVAFCLSLKAQTFVGYESVRKSVVFLYGTDATGEVDKSAALATGFLIIVPIKDRPDRGYSLLVTARHVVDPVWASCPPHRNPFRIFLRVNKTAFDPASNDSGVEYLPIDLAVEGPKKTVFNNPDASVDAVVITPPTSLKDDKFDFVPISSDHFATPEEVKQLSTGVEIISSGLLPAFPGILRNYPIFKFGRISTKPDERIQVSCAPGEPAMLLRLWFVAANLVAGNSGSPVLSLPRMLTNDRATVIGLQSISFPGSDVAGITPVQYIYEILDSMKQSDWNLQQGCWFVNLPTLDGRGSGSPASKFSAFKGLAPPESGTRVYLVAKRVNLSSPHLSTMINETQGRRRSWCAEG